MYFAFGYLVQAAALETSSAGLQAFLLSLTVVVCPALESLFEGTRQPPRVWLAAALAATGVAVLECSIQSTDIGGSGAYLGLLQPIFFGIGFYRLERAMSRHCGLSAATDAGGAATDAVDAATDAADAVTDAADAFTGAGQASQYLDTTTAALAFTAWQMVAVLGVSVVWLLSESASPTDAVAALAYGLDRALTEPAVGSALLWTGLVTTAGCAFLEAKAMSKLTSSDATVIFASEPLWAAVFAWAMLGETMGAEGAVGGSLILTACLVSSGSLPRICSNEMDLKAILRSLRSAESGAWGAIRTRVDLARRNQSRGGAGLGILSLLSPSMAEALEDLSDIFDMGGGF
jgi:drug/metabolite transporter (DMT)-like permease